MLKIPKQYKYDYTCCLPEKLERQVMQEVKKEVANLLLTDSEKQEAIENANNEKVCNLTDTISIEFI